MSEMNIVGKPEERKLKRGAEEAGIDWSRCEGYSTITSGTWRARPLEISRGMHEHPASFSPEAPRGVSWSEPIASGFSEEASSSLSWGFPRFSNMTWRKP